MHPIIKNILFICFLLISSSSYSQSNFKEVDSTSYALYVNMDWYNLIRYCEKAKENGYDYFYLNLRLGIAYFTTENYKKSITALEDANRDNSFNQTVKEYLFGSNYHLMKEKNAKKWYAQLDDTIQQRIQYSPEKLLSEIYIEGGQKISKNRDAANKADYLNFALKLHLSGRFDLSQSYTFIQQNLIWGDFKQHQYYLNPTFKISPSLSFNIGMHYANYQSNIDFHLRSTFNSVGKTGGIGINTIDTTTLRNYYIQGFYVENDILFEPRITKSWQKFTIAPYFSYYTSFQDPNYFERFIDTLTVTERSFGTIINQTTEYKDSSATPGRTTLTQYGFGADLYYTFKHFTLGGDLKYINNNSTSSIFIMPYLNIRVGKKLTFYTYFFKKNYSYTIGLFNSSQLINTSDQVRKFNFTSQYKITPKLNLYFTYQNEKITDILSTQTYKLHSYYLGLKLKL